MSQPTFAPFRLVAYTDEVHSITVALLDPDGTASSTVGSASSLGVYVETEGGDNVDSILEGVTVGGTDSNEVTFTLTSTITDSARRLVVSIREQASPYTVYGIGVLDVLDAPGGTVAVP